MSIAAGFVGNGWGLRRALAGNARRRHRLLLDRPHRLAGDAIEHIDKSLLCYLRHRLDRLSRHGDIDQVECGRRIVIPQPVMNELIVPDLLARRRVETHEALAIETVAWAVAA